MKALCVVLIALAVFASVQASVAVQQLQTSPKCAVCEYIVDSVYDTMSDGELFQAAGIHEKCTEFGVPMDFCMEAFTAIVAPIRAAKDAGVPPQIACTHIGSCTGAPARTADSIEAPVLPIRGDLLNGRLCGVCELMVTVVQNYLAASQSRDAVKATLLNFCNDLSSPTNSLCALAVQMYLPKIIDSLENQAIPNLLCTEVKLCTIN